MIPILEGLGAYKGELTAFFANTAAATQAFDPGTRLHYLRTTNPLNPENLAAYPRRIGSNRPNPYQLPGGYRKLSSGLEVYENRHCGRALPTISTRTTPAPGRRPSSRACRTSRCRCRRCVPTVVPPEVSGLTQSLIDRINQFAFPAANAAPAPACKKQGKFPVGGESTRLPAPQGQPAR